MEDLNFLTPQVLQQNPPSSIFQSPATPTKTEQYGVGVVPSNEDERLMQACKLVRIGEDPFKLKKKLTDGDTGGSRGFCLQSDWAERYILEYMDPRDAQLCRSSSGKEFPVLDMNDGSKHYLVLKKCKKSFFTLSGNWVRDFVSRKHLEAGDVVGLYFLNGFFFFKLLKKRAGV